VTPGVGTFERWLAVFALVACVVCAGCGSTSVDDLASQDKDSAANKDSAAGSSDSGVSNAGDGAGLNDDGTSPGASDAIDADANQTDTSGAMPDAASSSLCPTNKGLHVIGAGAAGWTASGLSAAVVHKPSFSKPGVGNPGVSKFGVSEHLVVAGVATILPTAKDALSAPAYSVKHKTALAAKEGAGPCAGLPKPPWPYVTLTEPRLWPVLTGRPKAGAAAVMFGGYMPIAGKLLPTPVVTIIDPTVGLASEASGAHPYLLHARTEHTATSLGATSDRFLVIGGRGPHPDTAGSWELWSLSKGRLALGKLSRPRWNHRTVRLPGGSAVGHVMVLGGEDAGGPIADYEVLRYDAHDNVASKDSDKLTCSISGTYHHDLDSTAKCTAAKGQPGVKVFHFQPIVDVLPAKQGRALPGVAFVKHGTTHHLWIVGGFTGKGHSAPSKRIDVLDTASALWFNDGVDLEIGRGAPLVVAANSADSALLVLGGLGAVGDSVGSPFVVRYGASVAAKGFVKEPLADPTGTADRALGFGALLNDGTVVIGGGVRGKPGAFKPAAELALWVP
jgi:hypothetical protein